MNDDAPAKQGDDDVSDHVAADLLDHQLGDLVDPRTPAGREQPHHTPPQPRQVSHEVDGQHQHGQGGGENAEEPLDETDCPMGQGGRNPRDQAAQLVREVIPIGELADGSGPRREIPQVSRKFTEEPAGLIHHRRQDRPDEGTDQHDHDENDRCDRQ
jgi:hypothetical protein